ncbi:MAG: DOMON domain-containing protein [Pseudomonadota bacterium]
MSAKPRFIVVVCVCFFMMSLTSAFAGGNYAHKIDVKDMTFAWTIDGSNLNVQISAKTDAWVGIGFNPSEEMKGADFILGYVKGTEVTVSDQFGTSNYQHMEDKKLGGAENVTDISGSEADGVTTIGFTIPLKSGDDKDQAISPTGDTTILLAYGVGRDSFSSKHRFRTALTVNLTTGAYK